MGATSLSDLLAADVPDPTDFPPSSVAPGLRDLDAALRCGICTEPFDAPVALICGHCFCSMCARPAIEKTSACPSCRKPTSSGQLRALPPMEELVTAWALARPFVLNLIKEEEARAARPPKSAVGRKRKRSRTESATASEGEGSGDDDDVVEIVAGPSRSNITFTNPAPPTHKGKAKDKADGVVDCPICGARMLIATINTHIDNGCQTPAPASAPTRATAAARANANAWSNLLDGGQGKGKAKTKGKDPTGTGTASTGNADADADAPLPTVAYTTLKDRSLRALLEAQHLPLAGDRNAWIARHKRWIMLHNANLDKSAPARRTAGALRRELAAWEDGARRARAQGVRTKEAGRDGVAYEKANKAEFERLVKAARESAKGKEKGPAPPDGGEGDGLGEDDAAGPTGDREEVERRVDVDPDAIVVRPEAELATAGGAGVAEEAGGGDVGMDDVVPAA